MSVADVFKTALAVLASVGGGGAIVLGLSGWLGKVWAERLMERERQDYRKELERLRADLDRENATALERVRAEWEVLKTKALGAHAEKIAHYQMFIDILAPMAADVASAALGVTFSPEQVNAKIETFEKARLRAYGYLAMFAPPAVMDAQDVVVDYLHASLEGSTPFQWPEFRHRAIAMLNAIREDLGLDTRPIEYHGSR